MGPRPACTLLQAAAVRKLVRAVQQGRLGEVEQLLKTWAAALGAAPGNVAHLAGGEAEQPPGSATPRERAPASLEERASEECQQLAVQPSASSSGGGGGGDPVDVRRWQYDYASLKKLKRLGAGSFGEVRSLVQTVHSG